MNKDALIKILMTGVLVMVALSSAVAYNKDMIKVKLDNQHFSIPKKNVLSPEEPFWIRFIPGLRNPVAEISLIIDAEEVALNVEGYQVFDGEYKSNIILRVEILGDRELTQTLDPNMHVYSDPWYGRGRFEKRIIEKDPESGFYKISNEAGYGVFWTALKIYPEKHKPIPENPFDFWIASCSEGNAPTTVSGKITNCSVMFVHKNILLDFKIKGFNLKRVDDIKGFLLKKLQEWEVS